LVFTKNKFKKWHKYCSGCAKAAYNPKYGHLLHKKPQCEACGFIAADKCQLDVVYRDGNKKVLKFKFPLYLSRTMFLREYLNVYKSFNKLIIEYISNSYFSINEFGFSLRSTYFYEEWTV
jgi:hypothetical protein